MTPYNRRYNVLSASCVAVCVLLQIVPELLNVMDDNDNPRVQAHGAAALVNFSEDCPKVIIVTYLDGVIDKLEQVLTGKFKEVCVYLHRAHTGTHQQVQRGVCHPVIKLYIGTHRQVQRGVCPQSNYIYIEYI